MQEFECRSVWSYAVDRKGASEEGASHQVCEDLETVGLKDDRIIAKDDQEPAIIDIAKEIVRNRGERFGIAMDNSPTKGWVWIEVMIKILLPIISPIIFESTSVQAIWT